MCIKCPDGQEPNLTKDICKISDKFLNSNIGTLVTIVVVPIVVSMLIVIISFAALFLKFKKRKLNLGK
jgi:hypothetical protein